MKIVLIRHGMTEGNVSRRYIGITDENLCPKGQQILNENIKNRMYPMADIVFSSTMKRCVQTAKIIYPEKDILKEELLKECDFGIFEGKNYMELSDEPLYQQWIDSEEAIHFRVVRILMISGSGVLKAFINVWILYTG